MNSGDTIELQELNNSSAISKIHTRRQVQTDEEEDESNGCKCGIMHLLLLVQILFILCFMLQIYYDNQKDYQQKLIKKVKVQSVGNNQIKDKDGNQVLILIDQKEKDKGIQKGIDKQGNQKGNQEGNQEGIGKKGKTEEQHQPRPQEKNKNIDKTVPKPTIESPKDTPKKIEQPKKQIQRKEIIIPSKRKDYDPNNKYNLWTKSPQQKIKLLNRYKNLPQNKKPKLADNFQQISYDKDEQFIKTKAKYEVGQQKIEWSSMVLTEQQKIKMMTEYHKAMQARMDYLSALRKKYRLKYSGKSGMLNPKKNITYQQFFDGFDRMWITGQYMEDSGQLQQLKDKQQKYYSNQYGLRQGQKELHVCLVAPTFNNVKDSRYIWHLQSIFQQKYSNYRTIIIDDASQDNTSQFIGRYLSFRQKQPQKFIVLRNNQKRTALQNIYYAVHNFCSFNQILLVLDGDDQFLGTEVLSLYNKLFTQQHYYFMYSNYLSYDNALQQSLALGLSENYRKQVMIDNSYRTAQHSYSQLRGSLTDLFLLIRPQSLKDRSGNYYWTIGDNAMYFSIMELSCGKIHYLPELQYWYTANTGMNDWRTPKQGEYAIIKRHITVQKHYHCIDHVFQFMESVVNQYHSDN